MTVFLSGETPPGFSLDPGRDLDGLEAREVEVVPVPGGTHTMMQEPHVAVLADLLNASLENS
jgi:thioesterase domain-containing protein